MEMGEVNMKNKNLDIMFLHPPANIGDSSIILDADTGYTGQFVSFPTGLLNMANNLERYGFDVKILNLGERMYSSKDKNLDKLVRGFLRDFNPKTIGIDAHFMVHSAGVMETSKLIKKHSPETKIILGGYTASTFNKEILEKYEIIDFVMRGQCDHSIVNLANELSKTNPNLSRVPGLTYRKSGKISENPPETPLVAGGLEITRYDLLIDKPVVNPSRGLITMYRGCNKSCNYCTGAIKSFREVMGADKVIMINPETVIDLIKKNKEKGRDKIYLYGDIRRGGNEYVEKFFVELGNLDISDIHVVFEFFELAKREYLERWGEWASENNVSLEATHSPESGNQRLRKQYCKGYPNQDLIDHCKLVTEHGIPQGIYFMLGIPGQTKNTIKETLDLADKIVEVYASRFSREELRHDVVSYNFMQIPDVGSDLFQHPEKYGFKFDFHGFEGLVKKLSSARHWTDVVGYETENLTKEKLIETYYEIQKTMKSIYHDHGLLSNREFHKEIKILEIDRKIYDGLRK